MTLPMPRMLYGTAWKKEATHNLVVRAIRGGFTGIDTACQPKHYNQPQVGTALKELAEQHGIPRSSLFVQTKFTPIGGQDTSQPLPYDPTAPLATQVHQSFETTLKELQTNYVDSFVLHSPLDTLKELDEVWGAFEEIYEAGKAKALGISNIYDAETLKHCFDTFKIPPSIIQNRFYPSTNYDASIHSLLSHPARSSKTTYQSFWTLTANPHILSSPALTSLSDRLKCTPAQAWFFYLVSVRGFVVLSGTKTHLEDDVEVGKWVDALGGEGGWRKVRDDEEREIEGLLK